MLTKFQQRQFKLANDYELYQNSSYGPAYDPAIPCVGYTPSHMARNTLSRNPIEIESALFGINSTNLVEPQKPVKPQLKTVPMKQFFQRAPLLRRLPTNFFGLLFLHFSPIGAHPFSLGR